MTQVSTAAAQMTIGIAIATVTNVAASSSFQRLRRLAIVHAVQNARKAAGLEVEDRIELRLGGDDELLSAAREYGDYIKGEVLAPTLRFDADGDGTAATIEGRELRILLARA